MFKTFHRRIKGLDFWDFKMTAASAFVFAFVVVRLIPELIDINPWWWISLFVLLLLRPLYHFWILPSSK